MQNAVSLDSRIDWIEPDIRLYYDTASRYKFDAHLAGSNTIYDPEEDIPEEDVSVFIEPVVRSGDTRPYLVVPDSRGKVRNWHVLRQAGFWKDMIVICTRSTPKRYIGYLKKRHVKYFISGDKKVDMRTALLKLNKKYNIRSVLLDSGGTLNGIMLRTGLVTDISLLIQPNLVGGSSQQTFFRAEDLTAMDDVIKLKLVTMEKLKGQVVWLRYKVIS